MFSFRRVIGCGNILSKVFGGFKSHQNPSSNKSGHDCPRQSNGVIVGCYSSEGGHSVKLSKTGQALDDVLEGRLMKGLGNCRPFPPYGECRVLYGIHPSYPTIAVVSLGDECSGYSIREQMDLKKESIRTAVSVGVNAFRPLAITRLLVDDCGHAESAAEGATLSSFIYQEYKQSTRRITPPKIELLNSCDFTGWQIGVHKAAAQNLARHLQETPANYLTPQSFSQSVIEMLSRYNINVEVRMKHWAKLRNLNAFLAAGQGTCDPVFMEIFYEGCDPNVCPVVLIGKGVTFNSGGICLKSCHGMQYMRGDMIGAACVVATLRAVAALQLPVNVRGLIPLSTNIIGSRSVKPGDTVKAFNGKTIRIDSPDCDGLLMHADALSYAGLYNPKFILDIGTMTADAFGAMGQGASLVFSNNESLFEMMRVASIHTGDRVWRFPLWYYFHDYMKKQTVDLSNKAPLMIGGGPCKAAAFLREFLPPKCDWIHMDIQNTFVTDGHDFPYLMSGMTGRPTRNIIEFIAQLACHHGK